MYLVNIMFPILSTLFRSHYSLFTIHLASEASASEIVSGALQDYDAAVIVGPTRTFGKGLVQKVIPLPYDAALKFTVARYYTPSGRCLQV
jgi:carboxyl-terminal processing protease